MSSCAGSAFVPSSRTGTPFTGTRPSSISCSLARREAIPAWERIFCNRSTAYSLATKARKHENTKGSGLIFGVSWFSWFRGSWFRVFRGSSLSPKQISPESRELQHVPEVRRAIRFGVRDETAQQHPDARMSAQILREVLGLDRRDHVVVHAVQQEDWNGRLRRLRHRQRRIAAVVADEWQQSRAEMHDVAIVDVAEQRRGRLGHPLRRVPNRGELARRPLLVHVA